MTAVCHTHGNGSLAPYINDTTGKCGWERPDARPCVPAVLVPVTQWDAVQRVIEAADTFAKATRERIQFYRRDVRAGELSASKLDKAEGLQRREADALDNLLAASDILAVRVKQAAAVQGIPVDTEAGNG